MASFHFFTLVTKESQYALMRESLTAVGFDADSVYTVLDNRERNAHEPYSALTEAVRTAQAPYVVFCHQDLLFHEGPDALLARLEELDRVDPSWAIAGNTGYTPQFEVAICLDDPGGSHRLGILPARVLTLDENFLVIRRDSGVGCSAGISGFHLYATDLCLNAYQRGFSAWVVGYRVTHLTGTLDYSGLHRLAPRFRKLWQGQVRGAILATPSMVLAFSRVPFLFDILNRERTSAKAVRRFRLLSTIDHLLRHDRPDWLPLGQYDELAWRAPHDNLVLRALDALLRRGRPDRR